MSNNKSTNGSAPVVTSGNGNATVTPAATVTSTVKAPKATKARKTTSKGKTTTTKSANEGPSKRQIAAKIFKHNAGLKNPLARKDVIARMIDQAKLTKAGAATYYQNFKSGAWSADPIAKKAAKAKTAKA